jgi:hypothetical protein
MKLSEVIKYLIEELNTRGDVEVYKEENDGRATYSYKYRPVLKYREIWKGHPDGKRHYLD